MVYEPHLDGSMQDGAANDAEFVSPRLLRPVRTEADARAAVIRSRLLRAVNAMLAAGAIDREIAGEFVAAIEGATA